MLYDIWIYDDEPHKAEQDLIFVNLTKQELDFLVSISQRRGYVVKVYDSPQPTRLNRAFQTGFGWSGPASLSSLSSVGYRNENISSIFETLVNLAL